MRGKEVGAPAKTYAVARKGSSKGGKGIQLVDKRMKNDKKAMKRAEQTKKHGKKGGLTGGKRRRSHS